MQSRILGYFETLLYCAHQNHSSQMTLSLKLSGEINRDYFRLAFQVLTLRHPLLRSTINEVDGLLCYQIHEDFNAIPIQFYSTNESFDTVFKKQSMQQLPLDKRNWSVAILEHTVNCEKHFDVIWHISHVVADGLSFVNLTQELVEILDLQVNQQPLEVQAQELHGPVESYLPHPVSLDDYFSRQVNTDKIKLESLNRDLQTSSTYFFRSVNAKHLDQLRQCAHDNKVTINNLVNASLMKAYLEITQSLHPVTLGAALNLRNKCVLKIPRNICGNYFCAVTSVFEDHELQLSPIELAQKQRIKLGYLIGAASYLPTDYDAHIMQEKVKSFMLNDSLTQEETLGSSFMGEINISSKTVKLEHFSLHPKKPDGNNLITTIFKGEMSLMFCFSSQFRTLDWANSLADKTLDILLSTI
jgi:hypothetical protein